MAKKKTLRELVDEPTFGDKITPVLSEIEDAILDRVEQMPGDVPCYGDEAMRAMLTIFMDVVLDRAFRYWERLGLNFEQIKQRTKQMGDEMRVFLLCHTDFDTKIK